MATAVMGRMRAILGLDTKQFEQGFDRARGQTRSFAAEMGRMAVTLGAALTAGVGALGGLTIATTNAATEIARMSRIANATPEQFQGWAAGARSVGIEQDKLADILKDVNDRVGDFLTTGAGPMADFFDVIGPKVGVTIDDFRRLSGPEALQLYVDSLQKAGASQQEMTFYMEAMASDATALLPLLRDGGAGMADYAQKARDLGAVMDDATVGAFARARATMNDIGLVMTGLRNTIATEVLPFVVTLAQGFVDMMRAGQPLGDLIRAMIAQLPRLTTYAMSFVGALVAWRVAAGLASLATGGLAGALTLLRGALLRTGIGAIAVVIGELVYQFVSFTGKVGGLASALSLLGDLAGEVWDRIGIGARAMMATFSEAWAAARANALENIASMIEAGVTFGNRFVGVFRGAFAAIKAIWSELPGVIGSVAYTAANNMIAGVSMMINSVIDKINALIGMANSAIPERWRDSLSIDLIGQVTLGSIENPYADQQKAAGEAARAAFEEGFLTDTFDAPELTGLSDMAADAREVAANAGVVAATMGALARAPLASVEAIRRKMAELSEETGATERQTSDLQTTLDGVGSGGAGKDGLDKVKKKMTELQKATEDFRGTVKQSFSGILSGATSLRDALGNILNKVRDMLLDSAFSSIWGAVGGNAITGSLFGALGIGANANGTNNWRGGLSVVNERGGEIMNLPSGTQIIPHDISRQMAASASKAGTGAAQIEIVGGAIGFANNSLYADFQMMVRQGQAETTQTIRKSLRTQPKAVTGLGG